MQSHLLRLLLLYSVAALPLVGTCNVSCSHLQFIPTWYESDGEPLTNVALLCSVNSPRCHVDILKVLIDSNVPLVESAGYNTTADVHFVCERATDHLDFWATNGSLSSLIVSVRIENCQTTWEDISYLGEVYPLLLVELILLTAPPPADFNISPALAGLFNLSTLSLAFKDFSDSLDVARLLPSTATPFNNVGVLRIQCVSDSSRPTRIYCPQGQVSYNSSQLRLLFPRLQTLTLAGVYPIVQDNLSFPWSNESLDLPFGLTFAELHMNLITSALRLSTNTTRIPRRLSVDGQHDAFSDVCPYQQHLNAFALIRCNITYLSDNCFTPVINSSSYLFYIDLSHNTLTNLPVHLFRGLKSLETLHLCKNKLTHVELGLFKGLTSLQLLDLDYNRITFLPQGIFEDLISLEQLFIHGNRLVYIEPGSLPTFSLNLKFVDFKKNHLQHFPIDCLTLPKLNLCNCDHNNITLHNFSLFLSAFDPVKMLFVQSMAYNGQTYNADDFGLTHETTQSKLSLRENKVEGTGFSNRWSVDQKKLFGAFVSFFDITLETTKSVPICDCSWYELRQFIEGSEITKLIGGATYLHTLVVTATNFQTWLCRPHPVLRTHEHKSFLFMPVENFLCRDKTRACPSGCECYIRANDSNSVVIDCQDANLTNFPTDLPAQDNGTLLVNLRNNSLTVLPSCLSNEYTWLRKVTELNLQNAGIQTDNLKKTEFFFNCLENIEYLNLADNSKLHLPGSIASESSTLFGTRLDISHNTITCCYQSWLKNWLFSHRPPINGAFDVTCSDNSKGPIVQLDEQDFYDGCENLTLILAVVFPCTIVTILVASTLFYVYNFEIKILLFEKLNWHPFDRQKETEGKEYDVFLMYSPEDELWVERTLCQGLEQLGYRIYITARDAAIGAALAEEMASAFSKSHRVVVVLSQSFVDSTSSMSDFHHAYTHDRDSTGRRFLVLVKLDREIDFGRHKIFKKYIHTNYFVPVRTTRFWPRLCYWLPAVQRRSLPASTENTDKPQETYANTTTSGEETEALLPDHSGSVID